MVISNTDAKGKESENMELFTSKGRSFVIYYHIRPDGDCIGSAYGLAVYLQSHANRTLVLGNEPVPDVFAYQLEEYSDDFSPDAVPADAVRISVDVSTPERLGRYQHEKIDICFDHHMANTIEAREKIVDENAASCTELLFSLLKDRLPECPRRKMICDLLFMGLITDTNCFRNESVRPASYRAAAEMAELGADFTAISQRHALIKSSQQMEMEKRLVSSYQKVEGYGIVSGVLTQRDADEVGVGINKFETLSSLPMIMEDTRLSLVVRELGNGNSRVAVRTRGGLSADKLARKFGGGGHFNAAGCTLAMGPEQMREFFVRKAMELIDAEKGEG